MADFTPKHPFRSNVQIFQIFHFQRRFPSKSFVQDLRKDHLIGFLSRYKLVTDLGLVAKGDTETKSKSF